MPTFSTESILILVGAATLGVMILINRRAKYNRFTRLLMDVLMAVCVSAFLLVIIRQLSDVI